MPQQQQKILLHTFAGEKEMFNPLYLEEATAFDFQSKFVFIKGIDSDDYFNVYANPKMITDDYAILCYQFFNALSSHKDSQFFFSTGHLDSILKTVHYQGIREVVRRLKAMEKESTGAETSFKERFSNIHFYTPTPSIEHLPYCERGTKKFFINASSYLRPIDETLDASHFNFFYYNGGLVLESESIQLDGPLIIYSEIEIERAIDNLASMINSPKIYFTDSKQNLIKI